MFTRVWTSYISVKILIKIWMFEKLSMISNTASSPKLILSGT